MLVNNVSTFRLGLVIKDSSQVSILFIRRLSYVTVLDLLLLCTKSVNRDYFV